MREFCLRRFFLATASIPSDKSKTEISYLDANSDRTFPVPQAISKRIFALGEYFEMASLMIFTVFSGADSTWS